MAELSRARSARSGAPWVRKFGNLCIHEILVLRKSCVRPLLHVSGYEMAHFNTISVKLSIGRSTLWSIDSCQKRVSSYQWHITASQAQVHNSWA